MPITERDVRRISRLARIRADESKIEEMRDSLNGILDFVKQLEETDCSAVEDVLGYATTRLYERKDIAIPCDPAVMDNAPEKGANMFIVPKVVG
ncbi:MAG: Asp-tRNA(Asn)/Glu-tRNA(Gln) amidotransferase subunit GatC [Holosporaceae bacterium]|jgi:aspartyl-tRNA(Asn)/glutamyl-tRNA(Gln) amidotransferase subunit C|nr:Asp-tRNA(Asn)/Glu-tRNA(Gln) amidotransferase subunit GatC [Holosporaceae bacterium]